MQLGTHGEPHLERHVSLDYHQALSLVLGNRDLWGLRALEAKGVALRRRVVPPGYAPPHSPVLVE